MRKELGILFLLLSLIALDGTSQYYTLQNKNIEISIDDNGNLAQLKNLQTGQNYAGGKPIWRLYFDREKQRGIQVLASNNQPEIKQSNNRILITYDNLKMKTENLDFELTLTIILEEDKVRFCSEINNNQPHTVVRELQYPLIGNCQYPRNHRLLTTFRGGHIYSDPKKAIQSQNFSYRGPDHHYRQLNITYPIGVASNCFALIGNSQGLYFGSHDSTFQYTCHGLRLYPDNKGIFNELETGLYKYPNCLSGESWSNNTNVIASYNGDWHETSKIYRNWANTWWEHREEPEWVKQMIGFQRMILRHQNGETLFSYKDFSNRVKKAGASAGINVAFPFGWWDSGMDNGYPDSYYVTDASQGGDKAWKQAVADYQQDGGKVIMYLNGKLIDTESDYYKNGSGKEVCYITSSGKELNEAYRFPGEDSFTGYFNNRSFVVADTRNPKWQRELIKMADRAIELGANSVFYDQLGYVEKDCNWDISKENPVLRLYPIADKANALKMVHDYMDTIADKDFAIGTEHITDVTSQYVDYVHGIYGMSSYTGSKHTNFIDWFRYTFPEVILTDRDVDGDEPNVKWLTNRAVLLCLRTNVQTFRLRGLIDETPRYQEYLAKVNQLVEKYSSLLLLGTYRDTEGFSSDNNKIEARSYINGNQMAIVMTHQYDKEMVTQISVPGYQPAGSDGVGNIKVEDGAKNSQQVSIGENGLVVLVYKKK